MSLINQALRKAQQDRSGNRAPSPSAGEPTPASMPAPQASKPLGLIIGLVVAVAVLVGLVVGLTLLLVKEKPEQAAEAPDPAPLTESVTNPSPEPVAPTAPLAESRPEFPPAPTIAEKGPDQTVLNELREAREAVEAKLEAEKKAPTIVEWLTQSRINAVRISPSGSKVIMNGTAYSIDEYVNFELGLKVLAVEENRVLFIDKNGKKYMKRL